MSVRNWISAFRPRTLFLAVASVILGSGLAWHAGGFNALVFALALLLAIFLQTLSNLANDLGDYLRGTDITGNRVGPKRAMQSGSITVSQMKGAIACLIALSVVSGIALLFIALKTMGWAYLSVFLLFGLLSILAALFYTLGKRPYGYIGLGDFFAFFFFGPVPVIGTYLLHGHQFDFYPVLPSIGMGLISSMVLNINNMRDIENDKASGKNTIATRLGLPKAKIYHAVMQLVVIGCFLAFNFTYAASPWYRFSYAIVFIYQLFLLKNIVRSNGGRSLDPYLKLTSMSGFLLAILFVLSLNYTL